jgi:hypothetical protein
MNKTRPVTCHFTSDEIDVWASAVEVYYPEDRALGVPWEIDPDSIEINIIEFFGVPLDPALVAEHFPALYDAILETLDDWK